MNRIKRFFIWLFRKLYIAYNVCGGDTPAIARMRWKVREMNIATIRATGRSMGRFFTNVEGEQVYFDFPRIKK